MIKVIGRQELHIRRTVSLGSQTPIPFSLSWALPSSSSLSAPRGMTALSKQIHQSHIYPSRSASTVVSLPKTQFPHINSLGNYYTTYMYELRIHNVPISARQCRRSCVALGKKFLHTTNHEHASILLAQHASTVSVTPNAHARPTATITCTYQSCQVDVQVP